MPSNIMDQRRMSSFHISSAPSSFFSEEIPFPSERQIGLLKAESELNHCGFEGTPFISGIQSVSLSPQEKLRRMGGNPVECLQYPQAYALKDRKTKVSLKHHLIGVESIPDVSMTSWRSHNQGFGPQPSLHVQPASHFVEGNKAVLNEVHHENGLFSSSLSDVFNKKLSLSSNGVPFGQSANILENNEPFQSLKEIEAQTIGNLLPDDDDLLSGVNDDFGYSVREDDIEEDLFCSGGGMELEADDRLNSYKASDFVRGGALNGQLGPFAHEHPSGNYPSRTLFVRNMNSNVEDAELRDLFEQYGDIHVFNTTCKHRGLLKISYYDIRAAQNAMRALQNKPLWHQNLDIQFYPKDNPSEKDSNPGTLVVFNLDSSVSNDDIHQIFGAYGEVKEVHDTPQKHHHKFIEFYDVRAAEAALHALNKSDIAGKRIKLESWQSCHPGDARCLSRQFSPDLDREEFRLGSVPSTSSLECFVSSGLVTLGMDTSTGFDNAPIWATASSSMKTASHEISSSIPHDLRPPVTLRNHSNQSGHTLGRNFSYQCAPTFHPHSLPECHGPVLFHHPRTMSTMDFINSRSTDRINEEYIRHRVALDSHSFGHDDGGFGVVGNGSCPLQHQYVRENSETNQRHLSGPMIWQSPSSFGNSIPSQQMHGVPRAPTHMPSTILPFHHHYIGSAPAVNPSLYRAEPVDNSFGSPMPALELASRNVFPDPSHAGIPSPRQRSQVFHGRSSYDAPNDRIRSRRSDASANQADNKRLYDLDIDRIMLGTDSRTTLMIKNIPNKYTSKMLLATIDEHQRGTYDFIYLPIDFKNKCNVGYAFINMIDPQHIIPFFKAFNGKKWEKFNSEKVASLAYARIQGKAALIAHFQNSSLMNEDKRCRPILFHTDGPNAGDQEPFPMGVNVRSRPGRSRVGGNEEVHRGSPSTSMNGEGSHHATHSLLSSKEAE